MSCILSSRAPKARRIPNTRGTASQGLLAKVEVTTRNSLVKIPKGGSPPIAITPTTNVQPRIGWVIVRPPISASLWLPLTWAMWPTPKKIPDLVRLCIVMCNRPAKLANGPSSMPKAKAMTP